MTYRKFGDLPRIDEIDIMVGFFEIPITPNVRVRIEPREFSFFVRTKEEIETITQSTVERLRAKLSELGGGVIWWRIRPEISETLRGFLPHEDPFVPSDADMGMAKIPIGWSNYLRFATSPELPDEFLNTLGQTRAERIAAVDEAIADMVPA